MTGREDTAWHNTETDAVEEMLICKGRSMGANEAMAPKRSENMFWAPETTK